MDPFVALSLASNIVQFVDFTWKLVSETRMIYKSATGSGQDHELLEMIVTDVSRLSDAISLSPPSTVELQKLAGKCKNIAKDLLEALEALKIEGKRTRWSSFVVALKEVWKKEKIDNLSKRLGKVQSQIAMHLQFLILNNVSDLHRAIQDLQSTNKILGLTNQNELQELKQQIVQAIDFLAGEKAEKTKMQQCLELQRKSHDVDPQMITDISKQMQELSFALSSLGELGKNTMSDQQILKCLYFSNILTRHRKIEKAHTQTFSWMFEDSIPDSNNSQCLRFVEWLREENGVFWVQGKAGSGKSTLMKFLCTHPTVIEHLQDWAQGKTLVLANYFFWNAGTALQRSQEGLLRSLIFEILRQCPELIPLVKDERLEIGGYDSDQNTWGQDELLSIYQTIVRQEVRIRFCFFIDGLDEYEERNRSHSDLIRTLRDLEHSPDIKLCVSSRPWAVFEDEFSKDSTWLLKLEDLTGRDIHRYVRDKFNENRRFEQLKQYSPSYVELIQEVVDRAQGVFLWVFLVVRNLLEGVTYGDSIRTLRCRLESFPEDLDGFFQHMITSIPKIYRSQTARIFEIACSTEHPLLLMFYSFLDDVEDNPRSALRWLDPLSAEDVASRQDEMRRRLDGRTRGLLEVVSDEERWEPYFQLKVDFLHRTVHDFLLNSKETRLLLQLSLDGREDTVPGTNTCFLACHAVLIEMKVSPFSTYNGQNWMLQFLNELFFFYNKALASLPTLTTMDKLLRDAEDTYIALKAQHQWQSEDPAFIGLAARNDLPLYLERRLVEQAACLSSNDGRPVLDYALTLWPNNEKSCQISPKVVEVLLKYGADPNEPYYCSTVWGRFIGTIASATVSEDLPMSQSDLFEVVQDLLLHGADLNQLVKVSRPAIGPWPRGPGKLRYSRGRVTAREVIEKNFLEEQSTLLLLTRRPSIQKPRGSWLGMFSIG